MNHAILAGLALSLTLAACTPAMEVGAECSTQVDCGDGLLCVHRLGAAVTPTCMMECELETTRVCADGSMCLQAGRHGVCYLGGNTAVEG